MILRDPAVLPLRSNNDGIFPVLSKRRFYTCNTIDYVCTYVYMYVCMYVYVYTGLFISPSGISELDCATTKTGTAERSILIGRESLQVFFLLGALAYFQVPPLGGSRDEKWRSQ